MSELPRIIIARFAYEPDCVLGVLSITGTDFECFTIERPWLQNAPGRSCIPEGDYRAQVGTHYGAGEGRPSIELSGVPGRSEIEIHVANRPSELRGCIAPGMRLGVLRGERAVLESARALRTILPRIPTICTVRVTRGLSRYSPEAWPLAGNS